MKHNKATTPAAAMGRCPGCGMYHTGITCAGCGAKDWEAPLAPLGPSGAPVCPDCARADPTTPARLREIEGAVKRDGWRTLIVIDCEVLPITTIARQAAHA